MRNLDPHVRTRIWQVAPIGAIIFIRLLKGVALKSGIVSIVSGEGLLALGWILGQILVELDHVFYAGVCNPQELTCQRVKKEVEAKNWKKAWQILQETKGEREKMPVRNMLTVAVILGMGIWIISSNPSFLAMGVLLGMTTRLLGEILAEKNYKKWYWLFAREFNETEHRGFLVAWIAVLAWEILRVIFY